MPQQALFLTGVTGALGAWIAQRALADGQRVRALARASSRESSQARAERSIAICDSVSTDRLEVIEGDILDPGLNPGRVDLIVHCAACTAFHDRAEAESHRANVAGLHGMLELARRLRVPFVHVSTAYVCGDRTGIVMEGELSEGQQFNNVYERTKQQGELLVRKWASETGLPATVLRPGIVLGDWRRGRAVRFNTLYQLMSTLDTVGPALHHQRLRLIGSEHVTKNIIPVDYFADSAWRIIRRARPGTFHVTHPNPISMAELRTIFDQIFHIHLEYVADLLHHGERATLVERMCHRVMTPYRSYMLNPEPTFDRRQSDEVLSPDLISPPVLDLSYFQRLLAYGRTVNWGRDEARPLVGESAPPARVRQYFTVFLARWQHKSLLPQLKKLSARFVIAITGDEVTKWHIELVDGVLVSIAPIHRTADCSFALTEDTFLHIVAAKVSPRQAFFKGQVKITGNIELGLKVASVLGHFFAEFPFDSEALEDKPHVRVAV